MSKIFVETQRVMLLKGLNIHKGLMGPFNQNDVFQTRCVPEKTFSFQCPCSRRSDKQSDSLKSESSLSQLPTAQRVILDRGRHHHHVLN